MIFSDTTKYNGTLSYTPVTSTYPASYYWGVDQSITYGTTSILSSTAGIVDTGTTLVLIATDAYNKYVKATGAKLDSSTGTFFLDYNSMPIHQLMSY